MAGAAQAEPCLYITLSETAKELRAGTESHGRTLAKEIEVFELISPDDLLKDNQRH
jgi:circadian clock protein KaiC